MFSRLVVKVVCETLSEYGLPEEPCQHSNYSSTCEREEMGNCHLFACQFPLRITFRVWN